MRTIRAVALVVVAGALLTATPAAADFDGAKVTSLAVDGRADAPLGVGDTSPRLSWRVERAHDGWAQTAYQIRAAESERQLARGRYLWDSGTGRGR